MLKLKNVTAVLIDGTIEDTSMKKYLKILDSLKNKIKFNCIKYFSNQNVENNHGFELIKIHEIKTRGEYSGFVMKNLPEFIEDEYVMILHPDGFPINLSYWDDDFLKYDYIGAPWGLEVGYTSHRYNAGFEGGNGGFNIRSSKFMNLCKLIDIEQEIKNNFHEDGYICGHLRPWLKENGCRFAPYELGKKFSLETDLDNHHNDIKKVFGFHGHRHIMFETALEMLNNN